jgi:hypothetical protein
MCQFQRKFSMNKTGHILVIVHPETASFGSELRFRSFEILEIAGLFLRFQNRSGLALNQNLPFPDGHSYYPILHISRLTSGKGKFHGIEWQALADAVKYDSENRL